MTFDLLYPPPKQKQLLEELQACNTDQELHTVLANVNSWNCGQCKLSVWEDVLFQFDHFLRKCCTTNKSNDDANLAYVSLPVDLPEHIKEKELLLLILSFMGRLIENSTSTDHIWYYSEFYSSTKHLVTLLSSTDMKIVTLSMSILYTLRCKDIRFHIEVLVNTWAGKTSGLSIDRCVQDVSLPNLPLEFTSMSYQSLDQCTVEINFEKAHLESKTIDSMMKDLVQKHKVPAKFQFEMLHKLRLVKSFEVYSTRMECILARLYALALVLAERSYLNIKIKAQDSLLNELTDILKAKNDSHQMMVKVKAATLTVMHEYMLFKDMSSELSRLAEFIIDEIVCVAEQNPAKICQAVDMLNLLGRDNGQACVRRIAVLVEELEENSITECNELSTKLSNRLHFLAVAAFQMPLVCVTELSRSKLMNILLSLLVKLVDAIPLVSNPIALPSWLCSLLSLIDQFEKYSLFTQRRIKVLAAYSARQWKWWHNYEWKKYDTDTNRVIDDAYQNGQLSCQYEQKGQTFNVHFGSMTYSKQLAKTVDKQIEWKPVVFVQAEVSKLSDNQSNRTQISSKQDAPNPVIESCIGEFNHWLLEAMVALMKHPLVDADTLQAAIRLCLRVTRTQHELACKFYMDGITTLLNITTDQYFDGIVPMTVSLIRHVFENGCVLRCSMESNILRTVDQSSSWPDGSREQHIFTRTLNPLTCRDPDLFVECAKSLLRIDIDVKNEIRFCRNDSHEIHKLNFDDMCEQSQKLTKQLLDLIPQRFELESSDSNGHIFGANYLLYILAELVRFCRPNVDLILKHEYRAGFTKAITDKTSALEFIFDHLLANKSHKYSSMTSILFKFMIIASDNVPESIVQIVALLSRAISRVEKPKKHYQIKAVCSLLKEVLIFTSPCLSCASICGQAVVKLDNQGDKLVTDLANSFRWLNLSSVDLAISASAILDTLLWLMQALTGNLQCDESLHGSVAKWPERYNRDERWNSKKSYQLCPLVHPFLVGMGDLSNKFRIAGNDLSKENPYYRTCAPFEDPQLNYSASEAQMSVHPKADDDSSLPQSNSITIFHGPNSEPTQLATRAVSCSTCRWYQECCLVDGLAMFELTALAQPMLMDYLLQCKEMDLKKIQEKSVKTVKMLFKAKAILNETTSKPINEVSTENAKQLPSSPVHRVNATIDEFKRVPAKQAMLTTKTEALKEQIKIKVNDLTNVDASPKAVNIAGKEAAKVEVIKEPRLPQMKEIPTGKLAPKAQAILGNLPVPEGLDVNVLLEIPENFRKEAIQQYMMLNNAKQQAKQAQQVHVNVLNELPADIRAEVLAQPQAQLAPQATNAPNHEMVNFINSLTATLRNQVLIEMNEQEMRRLPPEIVAEIQSLRQDVAQQMQQQLDHEPRQFQEEDDRRERIINERNRQNGATNHRGPSESHRTVFKSFVDHQSLCSLMCLLFIKDSDAFLEPLHLVLKTLCYHKQTRSLIIGSLFDILDGTKQSFISSTSSTDTVDQVSSAIFWKSITFNSTTHCPTYDVKLNVFRYSTGTARSTISIHPEACKFISENVFEMISTLTQDFPGLFFNTPNKQPDTKSSGRITTFFDVLLSMDKSTHCDLPSTQEAPSSETSNQADLRDHLTELFLLLTHPVIKRNSQLYQQLISMIGTINLLKKRLKSNAQLLQLERTLCSEAEPNLLQTIVDDMFQFTCRNVHSLLSDICDIYPNTVPLAFKIVRDGIVPLAEKVCLNLDSLSEQLTQLASKSGNETKTTAEIRDGSTMVTNRPQVENTYPELRLNSFIFGNNSLAPMMLLSLTFCQKLRNQVKSNKQFDDKINWSEDKSKVEQLNKLWEKLSVCLNLFTKIGGQQIALELKPLIEAYFVMNSPVRLDRSIFYSENIQQQLSHIFQTSNQVESEKSKQDETKFVAFITANRVVLNRLLHQTMSPNQREPYWISGPFGALVDFPQILDFDVKRSVLQYEFKRTREANYNNRVRLTINRKNAFEDSFRILDILSQSQWKHRFVVFFVGEEGQDIGGLLREWYVVMTKAIFNQNYALFTNAADQITYVVNPSSNINENHLNYFRFVGKFIAKAIYDGQTIDCHFTRALYKHILGKPVQYTDMEIEDPGYYNSLVSLLTHDVSQLPSELRFCLEIDEFGVTRTVDLIPDGQNVIVTESNKQDYVRQLCHVKMTGSIRTQLKAFLEGFYTLLPKRLIGIFNERELELLISGLPTIDLVDLRRNTTYSGYNDHSPQIEWLWRALDTFDQTDRAKFLQFVTGTTKVPIDGFSSPLLANRRFTIRRDERSPDRLPTACTCACQLNLPLYVSYDKLRQMVLKAVQEGHEGFGFA